MAKKEKNQKIGKQRTVGGVILKSVVTLLCPPAGIIMDINDYARESSVKKDDDKRHAEIQQLIDHEKTGKVEEPKTENPTTKEES